MNKATVIRSSDDTEPRPGTEHLNLRSQEFQSTKHALPPTRLSHTILHENASQERQLNIQTAAIKARQNLMSSKLESSKRYFVDTQARKERKWKREDEMRATSMNFPHLPASKTDDREHPKNLTILYKSPQYNQSENDNEAVKELRGGGSLLPYMQLRRERTEILQAGGHVFFMTKLPALIRVDDKKYEEYINYCGNGVDKLGAPLHDGRFSQLHKVLAPNGGYYEKEERNEAEMTRRKDSDDLETGISLSLPPLMNGRHTSNDPATHIKKEMKEREKQKRTMRRTHWEKIKNAVTTSAQFRKKDTKLFLSSIKERRRWRNKNEVQKKTP